MVKSFKDMETQVADGAVILFDDQDKSDQSWLKRHKNQNQVHDFATETKKSLDRSNEDFLVFIESLWHEKWEPKGWDDTQENEEPTDESSSAVDVIQVKLIHWLGEKVTSLTSINQIEKWITKSPCCQDILEMIA